MYSMNRTSKFWDMKTIITVKLVIRGHGLKRTPHQPWTKSYVPTDFCPFTPLYVDKLVMRGQCTPKNVP